MVRHDLGYLRWLQRDAVSHRLRAEIGAILRERQGSR
jgi:hypothetical protein